MSFLFFFFSSWNNVAVSLGWERNKLRVRRSANTLSLWLVFIYVFFENKYWVHWCLLAWVTCISFWNTPINMPNITGCSKEKHKWRTKIGKEFIHFSSNFLFSFFVERSTQIQIFVYLLWVLNPYHWHIQVTCLPNKPQTAPTWLHYIFLCLRQVFWWINKIILVKALACLCSLTFYDSYMSLSWFAFRVCSILENKRKTLDEFVYNILTSNYLGWV